MLVSIYMPTKNRLALLQRAVDSVLMQTHADIELWVVDDGSSDGSFEWLRRRSAGDPRLHVIRNEQSGGAPRARNRAILEAKGEFVTGLDDDDYFHERRIAELIDAWRRLEAQGTKFSCLYTQDIEASPAGERMSHKPSRAEYGDLFFYNVIGNQIFTRRQHLIDAGLFDELMPAWQDLDLFMRVVRKFGPALLVDQPLYTLELAPRDDRISASAARVNAAYVRLAAKVAGARAVQRQGLFLQRFGELYGYSFGGADWNAFLRFGIHLRTLKRLAGILWRQAAARTRASSPPSSRSRTGARRLRVLMFPKHSNNPYLNTLTQRLEQRGVHIDDFTYRRACVDRYDVCHIHWPDLHLKARSALRTFARHLRLGLMFALLRIRGTRIVWTVHNLKPHERHFRIGEWLFPLWFPRSCTHVISMTTDGLYAARQTYPALRRKHAVVIPHGHYRDVYATAPSRAGCRDKLGLPHKFTFLFFGNIRPYKNVPLLLDAFRALPGSDVQLVVAGMPGPEMSVEELKELAGRDERVRLVLEFVPEECVPLYVGAADVVVMPFENILNSGSLFLALSFNRRVLAPKLGGLPEAQRRIGERWIRLYEGPLTHEHLTMALTSDPVAETERVNLSAFDWDTISQQTLDFYLSGWTPAQAPPMPATRVSALPDTR